MDFTPFSRPSMAVQFSGFLYSQDMAGNSNLLSARHDAVAPHQWVITPEYGNQMSILRRGDQTSHTALRQDRLHDAVFARSIVQFSLTEEDGLPDNSFAPTDIEEFLNNSLPEKPNKSFAYAVDTFFAVLRHNTELRKAEQDSSD
jgi:hypothetical protein